MALKVSRKRYYAIVISVFFNYSHYLLYTTLYYLHNFCFTPAFIYTNTSKAYIIMACTFQLFRMNKSIFYIFIIRYKKTISIFMYRDRAFKCCSNLAFFICFIFLLFFFLFLFYSFINT